MPITIQLKVVEITGNFTAAVPEMTITGSLVGTVLESDLPPRDILVFPRGGIKLRRGMPVKISDLVSENHMTEGFTISRSMGDPPTLPKTLRYGGTLQSLKTGDTFSAPFIEMIAATAPTIDLPARDRVFTFVGGNQSISVRFTERTIEAF
jgi:hypothetical protein